jgi:hypothetical protein
VFVTTEASYHNQDGVLIARHQHTVIFR